MSFRNNLHIRNNRAHDYFERRKSSNVHCCEQRSNGVSFLNRILFFFFSSKKARVSKHAYRSKPAFCKSALNFQQTVGNHVDSFQALIHELLNLIRIFTRCNCEKTTPNRMLMFASIFWMLFYLWYNLYINYTVYGNATVNSPIAKLNYKNDSCIINAKIAIITFEWVETLYVIFQNPMHAFVVEIICMHDIIARFRHSDSREKRKKSFFETDCGVLNQKMICKWTIRSFSQKKKKTISPCKSWCISLIWKHVII